MRQPVACENEKYGDRIYEMLKGPIVPEHVHTGSNEKPADQDACPRGNGTGPREKSSSEDLSSTECEQLRVPIAREAVRKVY